MQSKLDRLVEIYREHGMREVGWKTGRYIRNRAWENYVKSPVVEVVRRIYQPPSIFYHSRKTAKNNIFTEEWDLLIILDTCRVDALKNVSDEYKFITDIESRWSVGANSAEWILNTFCQQFSDEIADTAYITSNGHAITVLEEELERNYNGELRPVDRRLGRWSATEPVNTTVFHSYIPLYDHSIEHDEVKYADPRQVTDHAIQLDRNDSPDRMVLHYMPPHDPYIAYHDGDGIRIGAPRSETSFEAYLDNLRWGLNEVELLLQNVDRDQVVITADHGENFRLLRFRSKHTPGMISPSVRRVPWVVTSATDTGQHTPKTTQAETSDIKEMLEALGYR